MSTIDQDILIKIHKKKKKHSKDKENSKNDESLINDTSMDQSINESDLNNSQSNGSGNITKKKKNKKSKQEKLTSETCDENIEENVVPNELNSEGEKLKELKKELFWGGTGGGGGGDLPTNDSEDVDINDKKESVSDSKKKKKKDKKKAKTLSNTGNESLVEPIEPEDLIVNDDGGIASEDNSELPVTTPNESSKKKKKRKHRDSESNDTSSKMNGDENIDISVNEEAQLTENEKSLKKSKKNKQSPSKNTSKDNGIGTTDISPTKKQRVDLNANNNSINQFKVNDGIGDDNEDFELQTEIGNMKSIPKWLNKEGRKNNKSSMFKTTEYIPVGSKGRDYTISIAIPASILEETCLLHELRTYVIGQIARTACIYSVDEIIVYNDHCWRAKSADSGDTMEKYMGMMKMILEYQECPQYLRKSLFPHHRFLSKTGVLNALNAPHHLLATQWCIYREGVVVYQNSAKSNQVDVGLRTNIEIDRTIEANVRVTLKFPKESHTVRKPRAVVVSPEEPRTKCGLYWGYTVRVADSLSEVFKGDRFKSYDLLIGTSDKGDQLSKVKKYKPFSHALVVFGGVEGLEAAMQSETDLRGKTPSDLFTHYLNTCPNQQSRTIRTEEAVIITMASLANKLAHAGKSSA